MADYYPLLTKTFEGLSDTGPEMRRAVYDRARRALTGQLRQLNPPLSEDEIGREGAALERAIGQIEERYAVPGAAPAGSAVPPASSLPADVPMPEAEPEPIPAAPAPDTRAPASVAIRKGGRRPSLALPIGFVLLAVPVGVMAWIWRDKPTAAPSAPVAAQTTPAPPSDSKYAERVGAGARDAPTPAPASPAASGAAPRAPAPAVNQPTASAPTPAAAPAPSGPELAVAQRAMLAEENPASPQQPSVTSGRAIWRLDALNAGQGLPLETVIQGRVEIADRGLALTLLLRRNLDPALPASHTLELNFTTPSGDPGRVVRDVGVPSLRPDETGRGVTLAGLPVPVKENVFLIGLSDVKSDVDRNTDLLTNRSWVEIPLRFASGQKALLLFDKGVSGDRIFTDAFKQWRDGP